MTDGSERKDRNQLEDDTTATGRGGKRPLDAAPMPMFATDGKGIVTSWSAGMERITGEAARDAVGRKAWSLFFEKRGRTPVETALRTEEEERQEGFRVAHRGTGAEVVLDFAAIPLMSEGGDLDGVLGILDEPGGVGGDIFEALICGVVIIDAETHRIVEVNRRACGMIGASREEILGKECHEYICPAMKGGCPVTDQGKMVDNAERVLLMASGDRLSIKKTVSRMRFSGRECLVETFIDTSTKRKALETLDTLPMPVFSIDREFRLLSVNRAGAALAGREPRELLGVRCSDVFRTPHCGTRDCCGRIAMEGNTVASAETTVDPGGADIPVEYLATPVTDAEGQVLGAVEYMMDQTVVKGMMADLNLKVSYLDNAPTLIGALNTDGVFQFVNRAPLGILGICAEGMCSGVAWDLPIFAGMGDSARRLRELFEKAKGMERAVGEITLVSADGREIPMQVTCGPLVDEAVNLEGVLMTGTPIVELKQAQAEAEEARRAAEEAVGRAEIAMDEAQRAARDAQEKVKVLDSLPTPVMQIDRDFTIRYLNPAGAQLVGMTPQEAVGHKCHALMKTAHCGTGECRSAIAMRDGSVQTAETAIALGGESLDVEYTASPLRNEAGEIVGAVEYIVDISDRKQILGDISRVAQALANADLTAQTEAGYLGDYRVIADHLNQGIRAQHDTIAQVAVAVDQVASAAKQISSSAHLVAQGASEQASSLEETSSSLEEISSQTKQNADNTQQAKGLAQVAYEAAQKGNTAMARMTGAMTAIKKSSADTGTIIKDINEIAFQTNLLALNAAVEAARAGDAGRSFAVVAEEVRNLALRAKEAAKKTEDLIAQSVRLSEEGETISQEVSRKLTEIAEVVKKVTDIASEIAAASDEQARGIGLVNNSVAEMDKVVQQAAANSEETSAAVQELSSKALELAAQIGRFELDRKAGREEENPGEGKAHQTTMGILWAEAPRKVGGNGRLTSAQKMIPLDDEEVFSDF